jgi:hypothetical protein
MNSVIDRGPWRAIARGAAAALLILGVAACGAIPSASKNESDERSGLEPSGQTSEATDGQTASTPKPDPFAAYAPLELMTAMPGLAAPKACLIAAARPSRVELPVECYGYLKR